MLKYECYLNINLTQIQIQLVLISLTLMIMCAQAQLTEVRVFSDWLVDNQNHQMSLNDSARASEEPLASQKR